MSLNRFRVKPDGSYEFYTFQSNDLFNEDIWKVNDGKFLKKEDETYYKYYLETTDKNGMREPDFVKEQEVIQSEEKTAALGELKVTVNSVSFDADINSISYMSAVTVLALYRTLKAEYDFVVTQLEGMSEDNLLYSFYTMKKEIYLANFKDIKLYWKNAENKLSQIQVETLTEGLVSAMNEISKLITGEVQNV
jgi:hypothetical protein